MNRTRSNPRNYSKLKNASPKLSMQSLAVREYSPFAFAPISAALPHKNAPAHAPSKQVAPCAHKPAITPDKTSPLPAFACPELPVIFTAVCVPFVITLAAFFNNNATEFALANDCAACKPSFKIFSKYRFIL